MKITLVILSTYLLFLSLLPCGDNCGGIVEIWEGWLGIEHAGHTGHDHSSNTCNDDPCSPLCSCNCCSIVLDFPVKQLIPSEPPGPVIPTKPSFVPQFILSSFYADIWQPPRMS